jgi:hypothetical protein
VSSSPHPPSLYRRQIAMQRVLFATGALAACLLRAGGQAVGTIPAIPSTCVDELRAVTATTSGAAVLSIGNYRGPRGKNLK